MRTQGLLKRSSSILVLTLLALCSMLLPGTVYQAQQINLKDKALVFASQLNSIPIDRLSIVNDAWLAGQILEAKVLAKSTGEIYLVSLHSTGDLASADEVRQLLSAELEKGFIGKVQSRLKQAVDADPSGSSRINIWVKTPEVPRAAWRTLLERGNRNQVFSESAAFHTNAESPVLQFIHSLGIQERFAFRYAPVVTCEVPNHLMQALEALPEVARIYEDGIPVAALNWSIPTIKAQKVWQTGFTGSGVKVAIVEALSDIDHTNAIANANPFVGPVTYYDAGHTQVSDHATKVAGVIASTHDTYKGVSYGIERPSNLLNGNPSDGSAGGLNAATQWAAQQNASIINQSYQSKMPDGNIGIMGKFDDYIIDLYLTTIAVCAGNCVCPLNCWVDDPAVAYNVIGVGAFGNSYDSNWSNDFIECYSSSDNPRSPHIVDGRYEREKPEIAAPGDVSTTFEISPWVPYAVTGTSYAAPHVAGTAALLMQAKPSLKTAPEEVKAILMASAIHNIEGATKLSDKDGAGGLQAKAAYDTAVNGWSSYFRDNSLGTCRTVNFNASAGQVVRFVICWLSQSDQSVDTFEDFDLVLKDPSGTVVDTSASFDNNFEIVEFTAPSSGSYTAKVCPKGVGIGFKPNFGWAYYLQ